jgi:transcriptional regulator with XRE-family HTH domain
MDAQQKCRKLFGERLREVRLKRGRTQHALSELAGLHRHYVSDIERGARNPCMETIVRLAWALDTTPADLFAAFSPEEMRATFSG